MQTPKFSLGSWAFSFGPFQSDPWSFERFLGYAAGAGYIDIAKALIKAGSEPDARNAFGNTPLAFAATSGNAAEEMSPGTRRSSGASSRPGCRPKTKRCFSSARSLDQAKRRKSDR